MPSISIPADPTNPRQSIKAFPIVINSDGGEKGRLVKQLRTTYLNDLDTHEPLVTFVNTYGFIYEQDRGNTIVGGDQLGKKREAVTAAMVTLGCGPNLPSLGNVLGQLSEFQVIVRKTSSKAEEMVFEIVKYPRIFRGHTLIQKGLVCVSAEKFVKSPGKVQSGRDYLFIPTFLSVTYCPAAIKFQVPGPMLKMRSRYTQSLQLELMIRILCKPDSPLMKVHIPDKEGRGCLVSVWLHVCNIFKSGNKNGSEWQEYWMRKCANMQLEVSIADMWGPTIIIHARGHIPKSAKLFFGKGGWSCHPLHEVVPSVTKTLWSVGCEITKAKAIIQESSISLLVETTDIISPKVKIPSKHRRFGKSNWGLFKKTKSLPNLTELE